MIKKTGGLLQFLPINKGMRYEFPSGNMIIRQYGQVKSDGITTVGIPHERYPIGVGYACIPSDIPRKEYIMTCLRAGKIGLFTEAGEYLWDTPIDRRCLQDIIFPEKHGELGSLVVFVNMPKHNVPIVVGIINKNDESQDYEDGKLKLRKDTDTSFCEIIIDGAGQLITNVQSENVNKPARSTTIVGGRDLPAIIMARYFGEITEEIDGTKNTTITKKISWTVEDIDIDDKKATWSYEKGIGYSYIDEWDNQFKAVEDQMMFDSKEILHGKDAKEPAVLGDTLESIFGSLIDAIEAITVTTTQGPSGIPINIAQFEAIRAQLETFKSTKNKIE